MTTREIPSSKINQLSQHTTQEQTLDAVRVLIYGKMLDQYDPRISQVIAGMRMAFDILSEQAREISTEDSNSKANQITELIKRVRQDQISHRERWQNLSRKVLSGDISDVAEQTSQGERIQWSDDRVDDYEDHLRIIGIGLALGVVGIRIDDSDNITEGSVIDTANITKIVSEIPVKEAYLESLK